MTKSKKQRAKDRGASADPHKSSPAARPGGTDQGQTAARQPPTSIKDFYLRVEGINIAAVIGDTDQLSVARGASFLLREAISDIERRTHHKKIPLLPENGKPIATGASVGEFVLADTDRAQADAVAAHIADYLNAPNGLYRHLAFAVSLEGYRPATGEVEVRERALARIRFGQLQSPTRVPPPHNTNPDLGACAWDGRRPADAPERIPRDGEDEEDIAVSTAVWERWRHGVERKQHFYRDEAALTPEHPAYPLQYSRDLNELAKDPDAGSLNGKVAVIYADGNRFSAIQTKTCQRFESLERFDRTVKSRRRAYLSSLLKRMATESRFQIQAGSGAGRLRLETLLWGGDELKLVVPAWCGFDVLQHLFAQFEDWSHKDWRLTHSVGIVFCRAKTPIQRSMALAQQLADDIKTELKAQANGRTDDDRLRSQLENRFDYMVLESIDFPVENDQKAYLQGRYRGTAGLRRHLAPAADWPNIRPRLQSLLERFPKGQAYALARAAVASDWSGDPTGPASYLAALTRMREVVDPGDAQGLIETLAPLFGTAEDPKIGGAAVPNPWTWLHLAELWDYLTPDRREPRRAQADTAPGDQP